MTGIRSREIYERGVEPISWVDERSASLPTSHIDFFVTDGSPLIGKDMTEYPWSRLSYEILRHVPGDTSSAASLKSVTRWLRHCSENHVVCGNAQEKVMPTRIVEIGSADSPIVRVIETQGRKGDYACLSHRWGIPGQGLPLVRSTSVTYERFKSDVPWNMLSKTFQDAIVFTRCLGLPWLWIDSLCIIQDDARDWERESAKMGSIYEDAYVTLSASAAGSPDEGCFTRQDRRIHDCYHFWVGVKDERIPIYARLNIPHLSGHSPWGQQASPPPLMRRAWVHQERLLSPRVVHFNGYEITWECRQLSACECGYTLTEDTNPKVTYARYSYQSFELDIDKWCVRSRERRSTKDNPQDRAQAWRMICCGHMALQATYEKDIFPSLSGLAKRWGSESKDEYLAGMWRKTLCSDMLWTVWNGLQPRSRIWRAPSWSWASVGNGSTITYFGLTMAMEIRADVIEATCKPKGIDPTGEIVSGHLVLSCKALQGTVQEMSGRATVLIEPGYYLNMRPDYLLSEEGPGYVAYGDRVHILLIAMSQTKNLDDYPRAECLTVRKCSGNADAYERIGWVRLDQYFVRKRRDESGPVTDPATADGQLAHVSTTPTDIERDRSWCREVTALLEASEAGIFRII